MRANNLSKAVVFLALSLSGGKVFADDLVAAILPLSRSPQVGHVGTAFATLINTSGHLWGGCFAVAPGFNGTFSYQTTDPTTNGLTGTVNTPFNLAASGTGSSQTLLVALQASGTVSPADQPIVFRCANSQPAVSIIGVNTLLFSSNTAAVPDIVALVATPTADGILKSTAVNATAAFAMASVNVGGAGTGMSVTADTGDITLPLSVTMCQTNTQGQCTNPTTPAASITNLSIAANATPTFSFFVTPTAPIPLFPASTRLFIRFKDSGGVTRGSTGVALNSSSTLAAGATAGGYYTGVYRVTSGPNLGQSAVANFIISETGVLNGYAFDPSNATSINTIYNATAISPTSALLYSATGSILNGSGNFALTVNGASSPRNLIAGLYSYTGETGEFYARYNAGLYERASSLALVAGNWNLRSGGGSGTQVIGTATISSSGSMTGSAPGQGAGCTFTGTLGTINTSYNAYTITFVPSSGCGTGIAGNYSGLTLLTDGQAANDTLPLVLTATTTSNQITALLTKY
jgi:hypothetical protein